jgi:hypothetical protein
MIRQEKIIKNKLDVLEFAQHLRSEGASSRK